MDVFQMMTAPRKVKRKGTTTGFDDCGYLTTDIDEYLVLNTDDYLVI